MQSSLRTRRPSVYRPSASDPKDVSGSRGAQSRGKLLKGNVEARKSRVGDKIKKRMSMRYADISSPSPLNAASAPAVPALPDIRELRGTSDRRVDERLLRDDYPIHEEPAKEEIKASDFDLLAQENFDPDAFLKTKLAHSTEEEIRSLKSSLAASKEATAVDIQRTVYKHYAEFVLISKEISTLENDMLELKESLSEWKSMPSLLTIDDSATATATPERRRANRSSVADLRTLYASQLQDLHMQIEGSSKFVPAIPGRHIVSEFSELWALNSATYKIEYAVHIVLLDDSLLVAKKRKKRSGGGGKLVAERCWPLGDIVMVDVKDSVATPELTNVIKIRRGKESHVFRTENLPDKKKILALFRQVAEELAAKKRKEREGEHERRRSVWTGDRMSMAAGAEPMPALPNWLADLQAKGLGGGDKKEEKDARWVGDFVDKLAVAIALREWEEAVSLVEQAQAITAPPANTLLPPRIDPLKATLISDLLHSISDPSIRRSSVVKLSSHLIRLGAGAAAKDAFLTTRAELMRKRARMIRFEGHIALYISELALVTFTGIKHTAEWYLISWREHDMASGMVDWAEVQIEQYATMFRRQVYGPDVDLKTIQESIQVTKLQSKRLLQDIGLDFSFLLDDLLASPDAPDPLQDAPSASISRRPSNTFDTPPNETTTPGATTGASTPGTATSNSGFLASQAPPVPTIQNRSIERVRSPAPLGSLPSRSGGSAASTVSSSSPRSPGIHPAGPRAPVPLPPRSRERPMSGNVPPKVAPGTAL
ncbi:exocyst complex component exo84 [Tulasnella sp. 403]|nr:exocyst complex component exo84 [Tulasnella sp. 403]